MLRPLLLSSLLFASTGCVKQYVVEQGLKGKVVDADTMTPIADAEVRIQQPLGGGGGHYYSLKSTKTRTVPTGSDGTFVTKPVKGWWIHPMIIPADREAVSGVLTISNPGHTSYAEDFKIDDFAPTRDVGVIELRSVNAPD